MNLDSIFDLDIVCSGSKYSHIFSLELMGVVSGFKKIAKLEPFTIKDIEDNSGIFEKMGISYIYFHKDEHFDDKKMLFLKGKEDKNEYIDVYISKSKKSLGILANLRKIHNDVKYENHLIGRLLGYPECCVRSFLERNYTGDFDFNLITKERTIGKFDWRLNNLINPYSLIPFFPCSYNCKHAIEYAENNLGIIGKKEEIKDIFRNIIEYRGFWEAKIINSLKDASEQKYVFDFKN